MGRMRMMKRVTLITIITYQVEEQHHSIAWKGWGVDINGYIGQWLIDRSHGVRYDSRKDPRRLLWNHALYSWCTIGNLGRNLEIWYGIVVQ